MADMFEDRLNIIIKQTIIEDALNNLLAYRTFLIDILNSDGPDMFFFFFFV